MWKFQNFSPTQILREINFGESRSSKTAVWAVLGALKIIDLVDFYEFLHFLNAENYQVKNQSP